MNYEWLEGCVPEAVARTKVSQSHELILNSLSKKLRQELLSTEE